VSHVARVEATKTALIYRPARAGRPPKRGSVAIEEFLRIFAPVTVARIVVEDTVKYGRYMHANERVILPLAGAHRDPEVFEHPNELRLDRKRNRHMAFGAGIHRCMGSHLARTELRIALEEWLKIIPNFELTNSAAKGQVRGPDTIPFRVTWSGMTN
jgi:cytochrome P450